MGRVKSGQSRSCRRRLPPAPARVQEVLAVDHYRSDGACGGDRGGGDDEIESGDYWTTS